jgi:hypothetical protein
MSMTRRQASGAAALTLAVLALGCAPRRAPAAPPARARTTAPDVLAALTGLPHCRPARALPPVVAVTAQRQHPDSCVAVRGRLFHCAVGWMLWEPSLPVPDRIDVRDRAHSIPLGFAPGGGDCDPNLAGITEGARVADLRPPGNSEVETALARAQPIVVVLGVVPRDSTVDSTFPGEYIVELDRLEVTHMCIADEAG